MQAIRCWPKRAPAPSQSRAAGAKGAQRWYPRLKERKVLPWHGEGRLLDFGCGGGSYLERMHRQGWRVVGIDASAAAANRIRQELGLTALAGTLPPGSPAKINWRTFNSPTSIWFSMATSAMCNA